MLAFIGTVIAVVGAVITYFQWRTAQQKVALDILEKRYKIYKDLRTVVSRYLANSQFTTELQNLYADAQSLARFHFGAEVDDYLERIRRDMVTAHFFDRYGERPSSNVDDQIARIDNLIAFYAEIDRMFIPYMRIDQRMPLWWWTDFFERCKRPLRAIKELKNRIFQR